MSNFSVKRFMVPMAFSLLVAVGTAWGEAVPVVNPGFETIGPGGLPGNVGNLPYYGHWGYEVPGWTITGSAGEWQVNGGILSPYAGNTFAYTSGDGGPASISQTVGATVVANKPYTLTVELGNRADGYANQGYAELLIGSTPYLATGADAPLGGWSKYSVTFWGDSGHCRGFDHDCAGISYLSRRV